MGEVGEAAGERVVVHLPRRGVRVCCAVRHRHRQMHTTEGRRDSFTEANKKKGLTKLNANRTLARRRPTLGLDPTQHSSSQTNHPPCQNNICS